jgi:hypothetical protein
MASKTHTEKLDRIQKAAARIISGSPRLAHSAPLLESLKLDSLQCRRERHAYKITQSAITGNCHPTIKNLFQLDNNSLITLNYKPRTSFGKKCPQRLLTEIYNNLSSI